MLPFKRTFDSEKQQLHELNSRLSQYLSRTKQLEQENAHLITEINTLKQAKRSNGLDQKCKAEMQDLRRMVDQLSFEKSQAEMEREKLWRELQSTQSMCNEQTEVCRDISGELKGCEKELHQAQKINGDLQQRLFQLENEYKYLEDAHRREVDQLRHQVESRVVPIITQTYRGSSVVTVEEVQEYARGLSERWIQTFEMYQQKVEEMEQSIKTDQAKLGDLQKEKILYASELGKLRTEAEKQGQLQIRLEEQLMQMQDKFHVDLNQYQIIIEQLEHERNMMADAIGEKMREHQHLLQVKMDLGMEVAAYRALLEGGRIGPQNVHGRLNQHSRERTIDIRLPTHYNTPRASALTTRQRMDTRYTSPTSIRRAPALPSGSISPSRVIPISVQERARHQSPATRRDMISFSKSKSTTSASATTTKDRLTSQRDNQLSQSMRKTGTDEKTVKIQQTYTDAQKSPRESQSVKVPAESKKHVWNEREKSSGHEEFKDKDGAKSTTDKNVLDTVSVEEIIEKVIRPAGLDAKVCSSGESKIRYIVEKKEQEDGTMKTQIVLESKVEEELDVSEDSALEELLGQSVKKVSLEDINDTATGSMIRNWLSSLQGEENLQNKSINVEIIEEPVESQSEEELGVEQKTTSSFNEPSKYFQIEEIETSTCANATVKSSLQDPDHFPGSSVKVQEVSRENDSPYFSHDQDSNEYFVSTPDDNLSEPDEAGGIMSYGHYGIVDDLSDEKYYLDENLPKKRVIVEESDEYKFLSSDRLFAKESIPECIIEEEVRVSPIVQESVLGYLREESLEPKEQLKGALEKLQSSVSGPLKEELAFLTKISNESPQKVAVKKVEQSSDNGTMTIVAELNVSQTLEDSGLLDAEDAVSEDQLLAALRSSNLGFGSIFQEGMGEGYSIRVSKEEIGHDGGFEGFSDDGEPASEILEKHIKSCPSEKSLSFKVDVNRGDAEAGSDTPVKISHEKRVATVFLENPEG